MARLETAARRAVRPVSPASVTATGTGFSLVELLAGLAIAGILASVGLSVYAGQAERSRVSLAKAEIATLQLAIARHMSRPGHPGGALPEALTELNLNPDLLTDPWGRPYRYARLADSASRELTRTNDQRQPLNRDYDLFSLGRDGATEASIAEPLAADDILRAANGGFVGTTAEYGAIAGAATAQIAAGGSDRDVAVQGGLDPRRGN
jgi:general secretion pathway protein G